MKNSYFHQALHAIWLLSLSMGCPAVSAENSGIVVIADTGQNRCYSNSRAIACSQPGDAFHGQDAQYQGNAPAYQDNGDGTVMDLTTGLMWSKAVASRKLGLDEAHREAARMTLGGHTDWRVPNIKELYSLIDFRGYTGFDGGRRSGGVPSNAIPFINTDYFDFRYGAAGERYIDAQWLSSTRYVSTTMGGDETLFGVNFADGRIKGYGYKRAGSGRAHKKFYVRYVRGGRYGNNRYRSHGDGTITDLTTGMIWAQQDSGKGMNWEEALAYAEKLELAGHNDWRLPNAKELQFIVDYSRSPDTTGSAAIDPLFQTSTIVNEAGQKDYPSYWTSTTHLDGPRPGSSAAYIAFGRAMGEMRGRVMDVHGAGAQRSDPKVGEARMGRGPQGDAVRVNNYVRVVRGGAALKTSDTNNVDQGAYPYNVERFRVSSQGDSQDWDREERRRSTFLENNRGGVGEGRRFGEIAGRAFPGHFVERLDQDGDGRVSRSEFDGPKDRFGFHDRNGDGYLSEDEAPQGPPMGRRPPPR